MKKQLVQGTKPKIAKSEPTRPKTQDSGLARAPRQDRKLKAQAGVAAGILVIVVLAVSILSFAGEKAPSGYQTGGRGGQQIVGEVEKNCVAGKTAGGDWAPCIDLLMEIKLTKLTFPPPPRGPEPPPEVPPPPREVPKPKPKPNNCDDLKKQIDGVNSNLEQKRAEASRLEELMDNVNQLIPKLQNDLQKLVDELRKLSENKIGHIPKIDDLKNQIANLRQKIKAYQDDSGAFKGQYEQVKKDLSNLDSQLAALKAELAKCNRGGINPSGKLIKASVFSSFLSVLSFQEAGEENSPVILGKPAENPYTAVERYTTAVLGLNENNEWELQPSYHVTGPEGTSVITLLSPSQYFATADVESETETTVKLDINTTRYFKAKSTEPTILTVNLYSVKPPATTQPLAYFTFDQATVQGIKISDSAYMLSAVFRKYDQNEGQFLPAEAVLSEGKSGEAIKFNGMDEQLVLSHDEKISFKGSTGLTFSAWIKLGSREGYEAQAIMKKRPDKYGEPAPYSLGLDKENKKVVFRLATGQKDKDEFAVVSSGSEDPETEILPVGEWVFVTAVWDGQEAKLYINGKLSGKAEFAGPIQQSAESLSVGSGEDLEEHFNGEIDELKIYDYALSEVEIGNNLKGLSTCYSTNPSGCKTEPECAGAGHEWDSTADVCGYKTPEYTVPAYSPTGISTGGEISGCSAENLYLCYTEADCAKAGLNWCPSELGGGSCKIGGC